MLTRRTFMTTAAALPLLAPSLAHATEDAIKLRDLYNRDRTLSDLAQSLLGQRITVEGVHGAAAAGRKPVLCSDQNADVGLPVLRDRGRMARRYPGGLHPADR